jgi:hypothetical protein
MKRVESASLRISQRKKHSKEPKMNKNMRLRTISALSVIALAILAALFGCNGKSDSKDAAVAAFANQSSSVWEAEPSNEAPFATAQPNLFFDGSLLGLTPEKTGSVFGKRSFSGFYSVNNVSSFTGEVSSLSARKIQGDIFPVCINGKWGFINGQGEIISEAVHDGMEKVSSENGLFYQVSLNGESCVIGPGGETSFDGISASIDKIFSNGSASAHRKDGTRIFILPNGVELPFADVVKPIAGAGFVACSNSGFFVMSITGERLSKDYKEYIGEQGGLCYFSDGSSAITVTVLGDMVDEVPCEASLIGPYNGRFITKDRETGLYGLADENFSALAEPRWELLSPDKAGFQFIGERDGSAELVDLYGNALASFPSCKISDSWANLHDQTPNLDLRYYSVRSQTGEYLRLLDRNGMTVHESTGRLTVAATIKDFAIVRFTEGLAGLTKVRDLGRAWWFVSPFKGDLPLSGGKYLIASTEDDERLVIDAEMEAELFSGYFSEISYAGESSGSPVFKVEQEEFSGYMGSNGKWIYKGFKEKPGS